MGADHHVDAAIGQPGDDRLLLSRRQETRQGLDPDRVGLEALGEGLVVLLGEKGRRHQDRHLLPRLDRLEGSPNRDLGLPVADIAEDETVHGAGIFHVLLDLDDGLHLIRGLLVGERPLQLSLPRGVGLEGVSHRSRTEAMQLDHLLGHGGHRLSNPASLLRPVLAPHP